MFTEGVGHFVPGVKVTAAERGEKGRLPKSVSHVGRRMWNLRDKNVKGDYHVGEDGIVPFEDE